MTVGGDWLPRYAPVAAVFAQEVPRGALCVMVNGRAVLDIWQGEAAPGIPWGRDTLACCFSVTKGVLSLLAHVMVARGLIAAETRIGDVWPGFRQGDLTLADILSHRAGLPAVSGPVAAGDLYDWDRMAGHLAASDAVVPHDPPVYHNMTYGHLLGEVLCRVAGVRPLSRLLSDLVTEPLGADFRLGLSPADQARCARLTQDDPAALFAALRDALDSLFARSMAFFAPDEDFNTPRWRAAEIGSGSGHATARAIAQLYGQFVWPDAILPPDRQGAVRQQTGENPADPLLGIPIRYGMGVELSTPPGLDFGPDPMAVGHWGAGGAQGFAVPSTGLAFGFVCGHMAAGMGTSPVARRLIAATLSCLERA